MGNTTKDFLSEANSLNEAILQMQVHEAEFVVIAEN